VVYVKSVLAGLAAAIVCLIPGWVLWMKLTEPRIPPALSHVNPYGASDATYSVREQLSVWPVLGSAAVVFTSAYCWTFRRISNAR
jgi:hypothetical protein